ncbi:hypothetical protein SAMN05444414_1184 [Roseovarius marisflavi]|uniref:Protein ImuA n=1 Tax=Roseovarius marisflavi TaxID=1054996 RepID=A0A1M7BGF3_9RHOB|nr:hypothetical protein [Roseovarius marisflavi]SHL53689.1 hypothetical protein SAMN05444414_1184 [Roseovarius marisflavi]
MTCRVNGLAAVLAQRIARPAGSEFIYLGSRSGRGTLNWRVDVRGVEHPGHVRLKLLYGLGKLRSACTYATIALILVVTMGLFHDTCRLPPALSVGMAHIFGAAPTCPRSGSRHEGLRTNDEHASLEPMTTALLNRQSHRPPPALTVLGDLTLTLARLHEGCGPARYTFAMLVAAASEGLVLWIAPTWQGDQPNPDGMCPLVGPERFLFAAPQRREDLLWCMEEALRSGAVPLVVADLPQPPGLTAVRRLHLAAEAGAARGNTRPLGLILTPEDGGAPGVETRWFMAPAHSANSTAWRLERRRARAAPPASWRLTGAPGAWQVTQT